MKTQDMSCDQITVLSMDSNRCSDPEVGPTAGASGSNLPRPITSGLGESKQPPSQYRSESVTLTRASDTNTKAVTRSATKLMVGQMHLEENTPKDGPNGERLTWSSFLSLLGLKELIPLFTNNGFNIIHESTWRAVFTEARLQKLGVVRMAHRLAILDAMETYEFNTPAEPGHCPCSPLLYAKKVKGCWVRTVLAKSVSVQGTDVKMNALSVLNALILMIPFSTIPYLGYAAYDSMMVQLESCLGSNSTFQPDPFSSMRHTAEGYAVDAYLRMADFSLLIIISPVVALACIVWYYIIRPDPDTPKHLSSMQIEELPLSAKAALVNASFRKWWPCGGRVMVLMCALTTVSSVLSVVVLAVGYHRYFISTSTDFCIELVPRYTRGVASYLLVCLLGAVLLAFGF